MEWTNKQQTAKELKMQSTIAVQASRLERANAILAFSGTSLTQQVASLATMTTQLGAATQVRRICAYVISALMLLSICTCLSLSELDICTFRRAMSLIA